MPFRVVDKSGKTGSARLGGKETNCRARICIMQSYKSTSTALNQEATPGVEAVPYTVICTLSFLCCTKFGVDRSPICKRKVVCSGIEGSLCRKPHYNEFVDKQPKCCLYRGIVWPASREIVPRENLWHAG